jgi:ABC-type antimicrobial peptide transport system permease subunit
MNQNRWPPQFFLRFFRWFCHPRLLDHIEGDLIETYNAQLNERGKRKADLKFIIDVLLLFRPGIIKPREGYRNLNNYAMIKNYFKIGWRNMQRNKGYSFINIGGLAIGMSVAILIALWIYDEVSFDRYNRNYERVAQVIQNVTNNGEVVTWWNQPFPLSEELRTNYGSDFKRIAMAVEWDEHMLMYNEKIWKESGLYIEKDGPEILGLNMEKGISDLKDPASILLSSTTARTYFGSDDPLNKLMKIDNQPVMKVIGVYEDFPNNSRFAGTHFIAPWEFAYNNDNGYKTMKDPWRPNFTFLFVEINEGADFSLVSAKIKDAKLKKTNEQLARKKPELFLYPMSKWHLYAEFKNGVNIGGAIQYVRIFGTIGVFVLLLACINFMNLSTARNERRAKEVGIRKTVGSVKAQLIVQFFSESFLTVFFAFLLALLVSQLVLPFFNVVANKQVVFPWNNYAFWAIVFSFITCTALIAGSYPAFYLSSFKAVKVLKGTFKAGRFAAIPRKVLVTLQFTVSLILIIGTAIVYRQIKFAASRPVGYSRESLVTIPTRNETIHSHFDAVRNELLQAGAVVSIAESQGPTTAIWNSTSGLSWQGKDPNLSMDFGFLFASYDFGKTINWHIKEGRDFSKDFASDTSALILNEAAVHFMNLKNPVGQAVTWFGNPFTVIGVIEDMVMESPYDEARPIIYGNLNGQGNMVLARLNPAHDAKSSLDKIEAVFKKLNPGQPYEYQFVDDEYAKKFGNEERIGTLASVFAALAIFISCLGLFGLASFVAEQRTKEIGVRKVLGASVLNLWGMLSRDFVSLVIISVFIATPVAYYFMNDWLTKYQYRTEMVWWIFALSGMSALLITLLTVSYQSIKAALANPVNSLRSE